MADEMATDVQVDVFRAKPNSRSTPDLVRSVADKAAQGGRMQEASRNAILDESPLTAEDIKKRLLSQLAYLSGGMDGKHPILTFPSENLIAANKAADEEIGSVLKYYRQISCTESLTHPGFTIVMDTRKTNRAVASAVLCRLEVLIASWIHRVIIIKSVSFLDKLKSWVAKSGFAFETFLQVIDIPSLRDLTQLISISELTPELGGTLPYNHQAWVTNRLKIENFVGSCKDVMVLLTVITDVIVPKQDIRTLHEARDRQIKAKEDSGTAQSVVAKTIDQGDSLLEDLEHCEDALPLLATWTPDYVNSTWCVQEEKRRLEEEGDRAIELLKDYVKELRSCIVWLEFKNQAVKVLEELNRKRDVLAEFTVGDTLTQSRNVLEDHLGFEHDLESLSQKCQSAISAAKNFNHSHYSADDVASMEASIENGLLQLQKNSTSKGTQLEKAVEFYTVLEQLEVWCEKGMDVLASQQMDSALTLPGITAAVEELDSFLSSRISVAKLQELVGQMPHFAAQQRAEKSVQRCGELHTLIENRRTGLNKIGRAVVMRAKSESERQSPIMSPIMQSPFSSSLTSEARTSSRLLSSTEAEHDVEVFGEMTSPKEEKMQRNGDETDGSIMSQVMFITEQDRSSLVGPETDTDILRRREFVMAELQDTERAYIEDLRQIIEGYWEPMNPQSQFLPPALRGKRHVVFGNLKQIYDFHKNVFIQKLEERIEEPMALGRCFLEKEKEFEMYVSYCKNKPSADEFLQDCDQAFFRNCQKNLGHNLPLSSYLLKPVQRITKYQLLLKDMMNCSKKDEHAYANLQEALSKMLLVLKHVNDSMHSVGIEGYRGSLIEQGNLLLQDSFRVWEKDVFKRERVRHVFLYEKLLILSKKRLKQKRVNKTVYNFKSSLKVNDVGLTEMVEDHPKRFIISEFGGNQRTFTFEAKSISVKRGWVDHIRRLLEEQLAEIKDLVAERTGFVPIGGPKPGLNVLPQEFSEHRPVRSRSPSLRRGQRPTIHRKETYTDSATSMLRAEIHSPERSSLKRGTESSRSASFRLSRCEDQPVAKKMSTRSASVEELTAELAEPNATDFFSRFAAPSSLPASVPLSQNTSASDLISESETIESDDEWDDDDDDGDDDVLDVNLAPDQPRNYVAIADFDYDNQASDESVKYLSLRTGDNIEVIQLGQGGWWFVRWFGQVPGQSKECQGWVPASYLKVAEMTDGPELRKIPQLSVELHDSKENTPRLARETSV
eukprot:m.56197 g.56197  ORF g.56197 m.56197 type:complete len:1233 (+) comp34571_c1_seq4:117-3815(+)